MRGGIERIVDSTMIFTKKIEDEGYHKFLTWLSSEEYSEHHRHHSEIRLLGTASWIMQHPEYLDWKNSSSSSLLLLHGIPGSGKTHVLSAVIDEFLHNIDLNSDAIPVLYFYCGDMKDIFNDDFLATHPKADVLITDPPRDGMHQKVVEQILKLAPERIVYVSCNSATQARDLALMKNQYQVVKILPVDMFPQTHHVENIALLVKK